MRRSYVEMPMEVAVPRTQNQFVAFSRTSVGTHKEVVPENRVTQNARYHFDSVPPSELSQARFELARNESPSVLIPAHAEPATAKWHAGGGQVRRYKIAVCYLKVVC